MCDTFLYINSSSEKEGVSLKYCILVCDLTGTRSKVSSDLNLFKTWSSDFEIKPGKVSFAINMCVVLLHFSLTVKTSNHKTPLVCWWQHVNLVCKFERSCHNVTTYWCLASVCIFFPTIPLLLICFIFKSGNSQN